MPTCSSRITLRPLFHVQTLSEARQCARTSVRKKSAACVKRTYAVAAAALRQQQNVSVGEASAPSAGSKANASLHLHDSKAKTLTLLHKTAKLLPRVIPSKADGPPLVESEDFWQELLNIVRDEMEQPLDGNLKVVGGQLAFFNLQSDKPGIHVEQSWTVSLRL